VARPVWRIDVSSGFSDTHEPETHLDFDVVATRIQRRLKGSGKVIHSLSTIHVMTLPDAHLDYPFHSVLRLRLLFHHPPSRSWNLSPIIPLQIPRLFAARNPFQCLVTARVFRPALLANARKRERLYAAPWIPTSHPSLLELRTVPEAYQRLLLLLDCTTVIPMLMCKRHTDRRRWPSSLARLTRMIYST
jgi:hypothetical protein